VCTNAMYIKRKHGKYTDIHLRAFTDFGRLRVQAWGYFSRDGALGSGDRSPTMRIATPVTRPTISAWAG